MGKRVEFFFSFNSMDSAPDNASILPRKLNVRPVVCHLQWKLGNVLATSVSEQSKATTHHVRARHNISRAGLVASPRGQTTQCE